MKGVSKRLQNLGFSLELTLAAKEFIAEKGYDVQFGARPLHRAIQKYLEDPLDLDKELGKLVFSFRKKVEEGTEAKV
jgi:ATP-dependent Clp protease ATP-binding subunit ClpC